MIFAWLPLLAQQNNDWWVKPAIFGAVMLFYAVRWFFKQLTSGNTPAPPVRPGQPPVAQPANPIRQKLEEEVRKFMDEARKTGQKTSSPPPPPQQQRPDRNEKRSRKKERQRREEIVKAEAVETKPRRRLEPQLEQHIDTSRFEQRASHMSDLDQTDEQADAHLHKVFDHQLGRLGQSSAFVTDAVDAAAQVTDAANITPAQQIAALLSNSQSVRQAVVLNEIFTRPEHRW